MLVFRSVDVVEYPLPHDQYLHTSTGSAMKSVDRSLCSFGLIVLYFILLRDLTVNMTVKTENLNFRNPREIHVKKIICVKNSKQSFLLILMIIV